MLRCLIWRGWRGWHDWRDWLGRRWLGRLVGLTCAGWLGGGFAWLAWLAWLACRVLGWLAWSSFAWSVGRRVVCWVGWLGWLVSYGAQHRSVRYYTCNSTDLKSDITVPKWNITVADVILQT